MCPILGQQGHPHRLRLGLLRILPIALFSACGFLRLRGTEQPLANNAVGFQHRTECRAVSERVRERLAKFGLELHPDKIRLIESGRSLLPTENSAKGKPETFAVLGFLSSRRARRRRRWSAMLKAIKAELQPQKHATQLHGWRMASDCRAELLPMPCCARQHDSAGHLSTYGTIRRGEQSS